MSKKSHIFYLRDIEILKLFGKPCITHKDVLIDEINSYIYVTIIFDYFIVKPK